MKITENLKSIKDTSNQALSSETRGDAADTSENLSRNEVALENQNIQNEDNNNNKFQVSDEIAVETKNMYNNADKRNKYGNSIPKYYSAGCEKSTVNMHIPVECGITCVPCKSSTFSSTISGPSLQSTTLCVACKSSSSPSPQSTPCVTCPHIECTSNSQSSVSFIKADIPSNPCPTRTCPTARTRATCTPRCKCLNFNEGYSNEEQERDRYGNINRINAESSDLFSINT